MKKTSLITGITGQDGSYLAELLLESGHEVIGLARRCSHDNTERIRHILSAPDFHLVEGDVTDSSSVYNILCKHSPDYLYNLAAQSHVYTSFQQPMLTLDVTGGGVLNILECIRILGLNTKFYQASSSEMFGDRVSYEYDMYCDDQGIPNVIQYKEREDSAYQDETTCMRPQSPYAIAKLAGYHYTRLYRQSYNMFACSGILFNHESSRRGEKFVTRKITKYIADLVKWHKEYGKYDGFYKLSLGNLTAQRDWGHAKDYVRAMKLIIEADEPEDYVVGLGETHSVEEFLIEAFSRVGIMEYRDFVQIDEKLKRPSEVPFLRSKADKIRNKLGWEPEYDFKGLVKDMVDAEIKHGE